MNKSMPKLLILGHGRHGKDTVARLICEHYNMKAESSSYFACRNFIYPLLEHQYESLDDCFKDRRNRRDEWFQMIKDYNKNDNSRLCREILSVNDLYVGMRSKEEIKASSHLFDKVVWVDASKRVDLEQSSSCTIVPEDADVIIDNNGSLADLEKLIKSEYLRMVLFHPR